MDFQRLIGMLKKPLDNRPFEDIIGHEHVKRLFRMTLKLESRTHILLVGAPAMVHLIFTMVLIIN